MKVGTICKLKVQCLDNEPGTLGVVFYDYGDGFQAIFENGNYDGFSTQIRMGGSGRSPMVDSEAIAFLEEVGFEESLAGYQFKSVQQVSADYRNGLFDIVWKNKWLAGKPEKQWKVTQHHDDEVCIVTAADEDEALEKFYERQIDEELTAFGEQPHVSAAPYNPDEQQEEKCKVYEDGSRPPWLKFKRDVNEGHITRCCMLSAAKDFADFSHFEYAELGKSIEPRWMQAGKTLYPQFVVFHKNPEK